MAGASLDVFAVEPPGPSPLLQLDEVVVTPHLGASTREAQDKAGVTIAEQVVLALAGDIAPFAVNVPAAEVDEVVRPFVPLAERLGRLFASLAGELPGVLEIEYSGAWPAMTPACSPWRRKRGSFRPPVMTLSPM